MFATPPFNRVKTQALGLVNGATRHKGLRAASGYMLVQIVVQLLQFASGLFLIRTLSKSEYAFYTLAITMQCAILAMANLGISNAVQSIAGVVHANRERFGVLIQSAMGVRRILGAIAWITVGPYTFYTLYKNHANPGYAALLSLVVVSGTFFISTSALYSEVPRMRGLLKQLQRNDLATSALRSVLVLAICSLFSKAAVALAIAVFVFGISWLIAKRYASEGADLHQPSDPEYTSRIWKTVRQQSFGNLYYCFQGPLNITLATWLSASSVATIANLGALGRLAFITSVFDTLVVNVLVPKYAKVQERSPAMKMFLQIVTLYVLIGVLVVFLAFVAPKLFLFLLGGKYASLQLSLTLMLIQDFAFTIIMAIYRLNAVRGWTELNWLSVPVSLAAQVALIRFIDVSTTAGIIIFSTIPAITSGLVYITQSFVGWRSFEQRRIA